MTEPAETDPEPEYGAVEPLETRVRRLEDAVAALQDTRPLEERVAERVLERLNDRPKPRRGKKVEEPAAEHVIAAERRTAPPPPEPPPEPMSAAGSWVPPALTRERWFVFEATSELFTIFKMFFDIRYRVAWTTRLVVIVLITLIFTTWLWLPLQGVAVIGWLLDKLFTLFLAFFAYKALSREAKRYQESRAARFPTGATAAGDPPGGTF